MTPDLLSPPVQKVPHRSAILRIAIIQHAMVGRFVRLLRQDVGTERAYGSRGRRRATLGFVEGCLLGKFEPEESRLFAVLAPRAGFEIAEEATTRANEWERIAEIAAALAAVDASGDERGAATLWDWNLRVLLRVLTNRLARERRKRRVFSGGHRLTRLLGDRVLASILRDFEAGPVRAAAEHHLDALEVVDPEAR